LRSRTGAPISECKRALESSSLNVDAAINWLKKRGVEVAEKLSRHEAKQGLVGLLLSDNCLSGALVEMRSQTDFVAMSSEFQKLLKQTTVSVLNTSITGIDTNVQNLGLSVETENGKMSLSDALVNIISVLRENVEVARAAKLEVEEGVIASYVHNALNPGIGQCGCLVAVRSSSPDKATLQDLGKKLAMHISWAVPTYVSQHEIPEEEILNERIKLQATMENEESLRSKTAEMRESILNGRVNAFFKDRCLMHQEYALSDLESMTSESLTKKKMTISQLVASYEKLLSSKIQISGFTVFKVGG